MSDRPTSEERRADDREPPEERYAEVDPDDVAEDAIDLLREGADDPRPVTPPPPDPDDADRPPPPNA